MWAVCVDISDGVDGLTKGKIYFIKYFYNGLVTTTRDNGKPGTFYNFRFKPIGIFGEL